MASPVPLPPAEEPSTILFRPSKKRKIYRQRARDDDDDKEERSATPHGVSNVPSPVNATGDKEQSLEELVTSNGAAVEGDEVEGTKVSMAEILRLRKRNKRLGGVEFRVESHKSRDGNDEQALVLREEGEEGQGEVVVGAPRRFAPQTGTVGDVNKHM